MAGKFKVDQDEVEVDQLLRNLDKKKDAYIRSQNWDAEQQKAFSEQYNKIRAGIADGTVSGRNSDRSYVDSSQSFQNAKEGYDSVGEVFRYVDQILDARPSKSSTSSTGSKKKYSNNHLLQKFVDYNFGGNTTLDMKAWEAGDLDEATGTYKLDNRKARMIEFLQNYRDNLGDDFDYSGSAYKDADDLKSRLDSAILAMQTTEDWNDELGRLGFGEEFRSNMFRTKSELYKPEAEIPLPPGSENWSEEQKKEYRAWAKQQGTAEGNEAWNSFQKFKQDQQDAKDWAEFEKGIKSYSPQTISGIGLQKDSNFFGLSDKENEDEDLKSIVNAYGKAGIAAGGLRENFTKDLIEYMSGNNTDESYWDDKITAYNKKAGLHQDDSFWSYDDYRRNNRSVFNNPIIGQWDPDQWTSMGSKAWNDKHFIDNYKAQVQIGGNHIVDGKQLGLGESEFYMQGMWDPDKFVFYTYDAANNSINTHRIDESPEMLARWKEEHWLKNRRVDKKQQGGIFAQAKQETPDPMSGLTKEQKLGVDEYYNRKKAGERVVSEDFQAEDFVRIGAMTADVASLVASFAPVYGTAASGVLGLGSTVMDLVADTMDESVSAGQVFTNLGANLGMAALGMIPGGKAGKIAKNVAKYVPKILAAYAAGNLALNDDIHKSLGKLTSDEDLTVNDWKNIGFALSAVTGLTRSGTAAFKARKYKQSTKPSDLVSFKAKDSTGKEIEFKLTRDELAALNKSKTNEEALNFLKSNANTKEAAAKISKDATLDLGFKEGRSFENWYGLKRNKITGVEGDRVDGTSAEVLTRRAYEQDLSKRLDASVGTRRLATDYEMFEGSAPIRGLNLGQYVPKQLKGLFVDKDYELYKRRMLRQEASAQNQAEAKRIQQVQDMMNRKLKVGARSPKLTKQDIDQFKAMFPKETSGMTDFEVARLIVAQRRASQVPDPPAKPKGPAKTPPKPRPAKNPDPYSDKTDLGDGSFGYRLNTQDGKLTKAALDYFKSLGLTRYYTKGAATRLGLKPDQVRVAFSDATDNLYYWKKGGIIKAQQGTQTKRRNVINNGADWNKHIWGSEGLISTLSGIQANEEDLKRYNDLQNNYSKLGFTDAAPGDNLTYNQDVANYQGTFENLTNINGGTIAGLIQQGVLKGRGGSSDKTDLWKGDGLAGTQTWLRHLGTNFTSKDQLAKYNEMGLHKDIEAFINPETNMVNFRLRQAPAQHTTQKSTPTVATQPLRASTTTNNTSGGPVGTGTTSSGNTNQSQTVYRGPKQHQIIDDMRYLLALRHNDRTAEKAIEGLNDAYTEPGYIQKHLRVQNNLSEGEPYVRAGEKVRQVAEQNKTADATTNALLQLTAQSQDNDYNIQRNAVLDKNVETQKAAALAQEHANQDVVHTVNEERKTRRGALAKSKSDILLAKDYQNWKATDLHMQGKSKQAYEEGVARDAMAYDNYANDQKVKMTDQLNILKNQWLSNNPGKTETDWIDSEEYKQAYNQYYRDYANAIRRYRSGYYGIDYTPVAQPFDPTWNKKGGKVEDRRSRKRIETAKMVNKSILEQVKNGDKRLDRFSKVTQKAILKALGL